ncbi:hypothetical protein LCGC14_0956510 [marine sediment metagenome]|uniref:Uncharacterized protein n=1 Tax=marine sediment metagenome TaxID=412755 RepID=A0A0F9NKD2_9ZZZZ
MVTDFGFGNLLHQVSANVKKETERIAIITKKKMARVTNIFRNVGQTIGLALFNPLKLAQVSMKRFGGLLKKSFTGKKAKKLIAFGKNMGVAFGSILGPLGAMLSFFESMGVFQPLMEMLSAILNIISAGIMEALIPVFEEFADLISDPEFQSLLKEIGISIGLFLSTLISMLITLFSNPEFWKFVKSFIKIIMKVATILITTFKPILTWFAGLNMAQLKGIMLVLFTGLAFLFGLLHGGPIVGLLLAATTAGLMAGLLNMPIKFLQEGGITTGPTMALLHANEKVIPLDKDKSQEILWATEDNGKRLDNLIILLHNQKRLR